MQINQPLHRLELLCPTQTDDQNNLDAPAVLRLNSTELIARGTRAYCLDTRNEILENRGYVLPQDWENDWMAQVGPVWTPDQLTQTRLWLQPSRFIPETTATTKCAQWLNELDITEYFESTITSEMPTITATGQNGFSYLEFDGTDDFMQVPKLKADGSTAMTLNLNVGAMASPAVQGSADFFCSLVINNSLAQNTSNAGIIANHDGWDLRTKDNVNRDYGGYFDGNFRTGLGAVGTGTNIVTLKRINGAVSMTCTDETPAFSSSSTVDNCDVGYALIDNQGYLGKRGKAESKVSIYEVVFGSSTEGNLLVGDDIAKVEGYLAAKYNVTPGITTYSSSNPPRKIGRAHV